jgi:hypothetical protein
VSGTQREMFHGPFIMVPNGAPHLKTHMLFSRGTEWGCVISSIVDREHGMEDNHVLLNTFKNHAITCLNNTIVQGLRYMMDRYFCQFDARGACRSADRASSCPLG